MGSSPSKPTAPGGANTHRNDANNNSDDTNNNNKAQNEQQYYPNPTGHEYDEVDALAKQLPQVIDDESRQQVEDYKQACNNGTGPVVACFATAEFLSLFDRQHAEAAKLFENVCFRPANDKSPNTVVASDKTKAYPAGCYNLAKMHMTGKGRLAVDRARAYQLFDRACQGGHGGACYLQAQILCSRPGALGPNVPHDPKKAMQLYQNNCDEHSDSVSCFTLATMLLRGDKVSKSADHVSPQEAQGMVPVNDGETDNGRQRTEKDLPYAIPRDPVRAAKLLEQACGKGNHVTSCHNLVVMYTQGDDGVAPDAEKAKYYKDKTRKNIEMFGGF